jgi:hypothetical protein
VFDEVDVSTVPVTIGPGEVLVFTDGERASAPRDRGRSVRPSSAKAALGRPGLADRLRSLASILEVRQHTDDIA